MRRANQLANYLRKLGVGPDVLVAISVERSPALIIGLLAILKAGGAYLPLDPAYPAERLAFMLQRRDSGRAPQTGTARHRRARSERPRCALTPIGTRSPTKASRRRRERQRPRTSLT